ncbi:hypothetical protein D3C71_1361060 [compost metagenome]
MVQDGRLRCERAHGVAEQEERKLRPMLRAQQCAELGHVGNEAAEASAAKVAQLATGSAPVAAMVHGVDDEACGVQGPRKAVVALAMLGKAVGELNDAHWLARGLGPCVGGDLGAVCVGLEGGGGGAHRFILAWGLTACHAHAPPPLHCHHHSILALPRVRSHHPLQPAHHPIQHAPPPSSRPFPPSPGARLAPCDR